MENIMLIVDDVEVNREILKVLFHNEFRIMEAEDGEEALAILQACQGHIDVVLLDLIMPGMSGFDLMEQRPKQDFFKNVPVVVISSCESQEDQVRAFKMGASDYIAKPFIPEIVISRVNNVMASSRRLVSMELETKKLKIKSELDLMTGLYNKATTECVVNEVLKTSNGHMNVLLIIDVDNFKTVNDTGGHQAGDYVLKIIANLISSQFRKSDVIGRIGGDEFCVLMVDVPNMNIARDKANELIQIMRYKPNLAIPEYVTLSIGMADNQRLDTNYNSLFRKADQALYTAKLGGKAKFSEYGQKADNTDEDNRPVALLISNNRSVCSSVHAMLPQRLRVVEALDVESLAKVKPYDIEHLACVFADVTDEGLDTESFWQGVGSYEWINMSMVFAICQEGVVSQYMGALKSGVRDMFTAPLDAATFKRRTLRHLDRLGLGEGEPDSLGADGREATEALVEQPKP